MGVLDDSQQVYQAACSMQDSLQAYALIVVM